MPVVIGYIINEQGEQTCNTAVCKAVCCRATHYLPGLPGPCSNLTVDNKCAVHHDGKPQGCAQYPRNQADIDMINSQAERAGFSERCLLTVIPD